jgi:hypothetical protein
VLHSHSINAMLATLLDETASEFHITHLEMIKVCLVDRDLTSTPTMITQHNCTSNVNWVYFVVPYHLPVVGDCGIQS